MRPSKEICYIKTWYSGKYPFAIRTFSNAYLYRNGNNRFGDVLHDIMELQIFCLKNDLNMW